MDWEAKFDLDIKQANLVGPTFPNATYHVPTKVINILVLGKIYKEFL